MEGGGVQYPRTGNGFAGCYFSDRWHIAGTSIRTYLQVKLSSKLIKNKCYYVSFYVNLANSSTMAVRNISLNLSDTALKYIYPFNRIPPASPQITQYGNPIITDTLNWVQVAGIYTAHGGEQHLSIGNFVEDSYSDHIYFDSSRWGPASYNIDDVSVIPLDSMQLKADAGRDTTIVKGDSVWIGSRLCGLTNVVWYDAGNNVIDTGAPGLWVKPTSNTFYVIEQNVCGQYSRDTVYVGVQALPVTLLSFKVSGFKSFNGNTNTAVSWETAMEVNVSHFNVQRSVDGVTFETVGTVKSKGASKYSFIDNTNLSGVVHYRLEVVDKNGSKSYSEIRVLSIGNNKEILVYPNPTKGDINIELPITGNWQITVTDMEGRIVWQEECRGCNGTIKHNLSGSKSLYFIKIINKLSGKQSINKIILQ